MFKKIIIIIIIKEKQKGSVGNPSKSFTLWEVQLSGDRHHLYPLPSCPRHDETVGPEGSTWKTESRQGVDIGSVGEGTEPAPKPN